MTKKILIILLVLVILTGLGYIFRKKIKNIFTNEMPNLTGVSINGEPSTDHQMALVYSYSPVSQIQELNAHSVRTQIRWDQIEKQKGKYDWKGLDALVAEADKANVSLSLIVYTGQGWGIKCDPNIATLNKKTHCPPADLSNTWNDQYGYSKNYHDFMSALAKRYEGRIDEYIIHNEVNTLRFWHGTPDQYLKLRKTAYKAIHDNDSKAIVIDNSMASAVWGAVIIKDLLDQGREKEAVDFFNNYFYRGDKYTKVSNKEEIMQAASRRDEWERAIEFGHAIFTEPTFDWIGFHFYEPEENFITIINWIQDEMKKNGYQKPIAMTEGGFADARVQVNESEINQNVASDLVKMHLEGFAKDLKMFAWLPVQEGILKGDFNSKLKGLFDQSGKILPAGKSWSYLNSLIIKGTVIKDESKSNLKIYSINNNGSNTYVVWSNEDQEISGSDINLGFFEVMDIYGTSLKKDAKSYSVSSIPIYIK